MGNNKVIQLGVGVILVGIILVFAGCTNRPSFSFNVDNRRITIITEPSGASVTQLRPMCQPSMKLGVTPLKEQSVLVVTEITKMKHLSFNDVQHLSKHVDNVVVKIEKEGYVPYEGTLKTEKDKTITHEITLQKKTN